MRRTYCLALFLLFVMNFQSLRAQTTATTSADAIQAALQQKFVGEMLTLRTT